MPEHPAAAVQHNARMVPGPPSTGVAIAMDGGTLISLNPLRGSPLRLFVLLVLKHLEDEVYIRCVGFSEFVKRMDRVSAQREFGLRGHPAC